MQLNLFGLRFERHTTKSPSIHLVIETKEPLLAGRWTAAISSAKPKKNTQFWCSIAVTDGQSLNHYGAMTDGFGKFAFLFGDKKSWAGITTLDSPAGSLILTGKISGKQLAGQFTFSPDSKYSAEAGKLLREAPSLLEMLSLGLHEITLDDIAAYSKTELRVRANDVIRLRKSGASPEYCVAVRRARDFSVDEIVRLRNASVASEFPSAMQSAGYDFNAHDLVRLRNSGVSVDFARDWKNAGFDYNPESLIRMRNSGVNSGLSKAVRDAFPDASSEQIVGFRNAGITAQFITGMKKADSNLTVEQIIRLRNSGVIPEYVKAWRDAGYSYSADEVIRLRNAGVPAEYAAATSVAGRKPLNSATLIRLRNRGLSAEEIRELRE